MQKELTILVVDDSATVRQTVKNTLAEMGYGNVQWAANGSEALEHCRQQAFQVIFLDWNMPELNGLEFLKIYRNELNVKNSAVIMLTAVAGKSDILTALECGATDYVIKPVSIETIKKKMAQAEEWLAVRKEKS